MKKEVNQMSQTVMKKGILKSAEEIVKNYVHKVYTGKADDELEQFDEKIKSATSVKQIQKIKSHIIRSKADCQTALRGDEKLYQFAVGGLAPTSVVAGAVGGIVGGAYRTKKVRETKGKLSKHLEELNKLEGKASAKLKELQKKEGS